MRISYGHPVLAYLFGFPVAPKAPGIVLTSENRRVATKRIDQMLTELGLTRHQDKWSWAEITRIEHLEMLLASVEMRFFIFEENAGRIRRMTVKLLEEAEKSRPGVPRECLRSFVSLSVPLPLAMQCVRFHTSFLNGDLAHNTKGCPMPKTARQERDVN
jgi:hypothetical protein